MSNRAELKDCDENENQDEWQERIDASQNIRLEQEKSVRRDLFNSKSNKSSKKSSPTNIDEERLMKALQQFQDQMMSQMSTFQGLICKEINALKGTKNGNKPNNISSRNLKCEYLGI